MKDEEVFEFVRDVFRNDKTTYSYHGAVSERKTGELPKSGKRWRTPSEMAQEFAKEHFKDRYHELWEPDKE